MLIQLRELRAKAIDHNVGLVTRWEPVARLLTKAAFADLCDLTNSPTSFMKQLPATLACQIFNFQLKQSKIKRVDIVVDGETAQEINF